MKRKKYFPWFKIPTQKITLILPSQEGLGAVYLGNIDAAINQQLLQAYNIQSVLTIANGACILFLSELPYPNKIITSHLYIPAQDVPFYNISKHFNTTSQFIQNARKSYNIFIHCFAGISRSAATLIAYMMMKMGIRLIHALKFCKRKRPVIGPNYGFINQLKRLDKQLFEKQNLIYSSPKKSKNIQIRPLMIKK